MISVSMNDFHRLYRNEERGWNAEISGMMNGAETIPRRGIFKRHKPTNRAVTPVTPRLNETDRLPFRYYYTSLY
jgi:hypothetical protein